MRRQYQIPSRVEGVLVTGVKQGGSAWGAGLRPGAIIHEINRIPVNSLDDMVNLNVGEKDVLLRVWMNGGSAYVVIQNEPLG